MTQEMEIKKLKQFINSYPGEHYYMGESDYAEDAVEQENRYNEVLLIKAEKRLNYLITKNS